MSIIRKLEIFDVCVVFRLLYGLQTCWLGAAELSRLDAFHVRCFRRILKILPSHISRIPNDVVYGYAGRRLLRYKLLEYQLALFGYVARLPNADAVRLALLRQGDVRPAQFNFKKQGGQKHQ